MVQKISLNEREHIYKLLCEKASIGKISVTLKRHISTIYRELQRLPINDYSPTVAHSQATLNARNSKKKQKLQNNELRSYVFRKLYDFWSPEQISQRLLKDYPEGAQMKISHETIYQFIYKIQDVQERENIVACLRQRKKRRYSRKRKNDKRGTIVNLVPIKERPKEVEKREEIGHWEGDLIIGKDHQTAIGTLVERKLRYTLIVPLFEKKDTVTTVKSFAKALDKVPSSMKKSLTYDRGKEMAWHQVFTELTGILVFFADPYAPWQRGTNENTNGLIRQFFPKKTDFSKYSVDDFQRVQDLLNRRPRKVLGYKTPQEEFISIL